MAPPANRLRGPEKRGKRQGKREREEGAGHEGADLEDEELAPVELRRPLKRAETTNELLDKESKQLGDELEGYEWRSEDSPWLHMLTKNQEEGFDLQHAQLEGEDGVFSITSAHFRSVGPRPRIPWTPGCWMSGKLTDAGGGAPVSDDAWTHQSAGPLPRHASLPPADSATPLDGALPSALLPKPLRSTTNIGLLQDLRAWGLQLD